MALSAGFVQTLVEYAEQIDDITPLETLRDSLFTKIAAGQSKQLVDSTVNGKTFRWQAPVTNEELFNAVVMAIKIFNGDAGSGPITFIDFSGTGDRAFSPIA